MARAVDIELAIEREAIAKLRAAVEAGLRSQLILRGETSRPPDIQMSIWSLAKVDVTLRDPGQILGSCRRRTLDTYTYRPPPSSPRAT